MDAIGETNSSFHVARNGILTRVSLLDNAAHKVVPASMQRQVLKCFHYSLLAGHPGARRMYDSIRREFYWPHMANDVYQVVKESNSCARMRGTRHAHQKHLRLFPANGPLEFVAMDLLGPLPKTTKGNQNVLVITARYSKLTRAVPLTKTTANHVATAFLENWVISYEIPNYLLTDNGLQFVAKFFAAICLYMGLNQVTTTAYHPQTNGQTERYNKTIVARLRHYVAEHQSDWDVYVQPLTYDYHSQVHSSKKTTPFSLTLTRNPPSPETT